MSISSMTNVAIARRTDDLGRQVQGTPTPPRTVTEVAKATGSAEQTENPGSAALKAIVTYIPTEVIGLYIAALASVRAASAEPQSAAGNLSSELNTFWIFFILTPFVTWAVYSGKVKTAGKPLPLNPSKWPLWEMFSSTVAFTAWAYALPDSPFARYEWYTLALASFVVLVASTALGLVAPIVQRPLKT